MKRRGFFGAIAALVASPVLAKLQVLDAPRMFLYTLPEVNNLCEIYIADAAEKLRDQIDQDVMEQFRIELYAGNGKLLAARDYRRDSDSAS
jgi:hypothetical protein